MKKLIVVTLFLGALQAQALISVGETVPNKCWNTVAGSSFCLNDAQNQVRVLLYNAGWCGPCNSEFSELVPQVHKYDNKPVTFISLSASGWTQSASPSQQFLTEWKQKYQIPFVVAASPRDAGKDFQGSGYIPYVAIVDQSGKLAFAEVNPGVGPMFRQIDALLNSFEVCS